MIDSYQKRISGPMLDRIDTQVEAPRVDYEKLTGNTLGESSAAVRSRVEAARERQRARFKGTPLHTNADMGPAEVRRFCQLDEASRGLTKTASTSWG